MKKAYVVSMAVTFVALLGQSAVHAAISEVDKLVKTCETRAAQQGTSGRMCACIPKKMHEAGFSDKEIVMYSKPGYKPQDALQTSRYYDYSIKLRLMPGQCPR